jgi:decaprenyl-phosphate phosphoribosyltransferase
VRQWTKNLLVFAVPVGAGLGGRKDVLVPAALSFIVFCLLASAVYLLNDLSDLAEDRHHPVKRHRPIASGALPGERAIAAAVIALGLGLGLSLAVGPGLLAVACGYAVLNAVYSRWLRGVAIADLVVIAVAFVLRATAGGVATGLAVSPWLLAAVAFGALFIAAGKRYADFLDPMARRSRPVLRRYSDGLLRRLIASACAVALLAYCGWALSAVRAESVPWRELTILPLGLGLLRYGRIAMAGGGGAPEEILLRDRSTQLVALTWLLMVGIGA